MNVFPVTTRNHTSQEIALARADHEKLRALVTYKNEIEIVKAIIDAEGCGEANSALETALGASPIYRRWQKAMPYLRDVPHICSFRNKPKSNIDVNAVNGEIIQVGGYLQEAQILFRGGCFPDHNLQISNGPISTSTMPSVARWHAIKVGGDIAVLKIAKRNSVKCFPFRTSGNQKLTHEFEVLLQNNLKLTFVTSFTHAEMKVVQYDVEAA